MCNERACLGSVMALPGRGEEPRAPHEVLSDAHDFLSQYFASIRRRHTTTTHESLPLLSSSRMHRNSVKEARGGEGGRGWGALYLRSTSFAGNSERQSFASECVLAHYCPEFDIVLTVGVGPRGLGVVRPLASSGRCRALAVTWPTAFRVAPVRRRRPRPPRSKLRRALTEPPCTVRRTKLFRSNLVANDTLRRYYAARPFLLLRRVPILRHCNAFVTNFPAANFVLYYKCTTSAKRPRFCVDDVQREPARDPVALMRYIENVAKKKMSDPELPPHFRCFLALSYAASRSGRAGFALDRVPGGNSCTYPLAGCLIHPSFENAS
ncbi:Nitric oxide synthase [Eumeta japonica]|uniref:Nitric oxide synthase n=1 Tax=Eumeta variegata TaxID=151549 RepID=A0A4C1V0J3_EUMVA|nr:Nitric oxide synthase [Eumeta japonica]